VRWVTGGRCALYELVLLEVRAVRLEEVLLPPPAPPAIFANCSGVSCFFGSFMMIYSFCSVSGGCFGLWTGYWLLGGRARSAMGHGRTMRAVRTGAARGPSAATGGGAAAAACAACNFGQLFRSELFLWIVHGDWFFLFCGWLLFWLVDRLLATL
jgi:hypothetical protein